MTKALRTALVVSAAIIVMTVTINLLTSPGFLWCVYPVLGILWWPLSVFFAGRRQPLAYAVCGTALILALFVFTYWLASPGAHPWILYPALAVLWWPLSVWGSRSGARAFSVAGGAYTMFTLLLINLIASPGFWWWVYPAFFVLWWPMSVLLGDRAKTIAYAVFSAVAAILFTVVIHRVQTPDALPWYLFTLLPLLWWPVSRALAPRVGSLRMALVSVIVFAAYYTALTALLFTAQSLLSLCSLAGAAWILYALGISKHRDSAGFAALNAVLLSGYFILMHRLFSPEAQAWYWYTFFPLAGWVYALALGKKAFKPRPTALYAAAMLLYYGALNLLLSPQVPWVLFLTYPAVSAVLVSICRERRAYLQLSIWMALSGIAYFGAINLVFTPRAVWAVYPAFALLWWPLSMWLHTRRVQEEPPAH